MSGAKRPLHSGPPLLDRAAIRKNFDGASATYDGSAVLQARLRQQMIERLDWIAFTPEVVVDLGCGTGHAAASLSRRWPQARVIAVDFAPGMLREAARRTEAPRIERLCADAASLPLPDASADLLFCNLMLPWCDDPDAVFAEMARVLRPRGLLTFSTFGPDTLIELREAWRAADDATHVIPFTDMHDIGDGLVRAGLVEPVLDVCRYTLTYPDLGSLMRDLKAIGARNATAGRPRGLTGRKRLRAVEQAYERHREGGVLPASYEAIFGQAWGAMPRTDRARGDAFAIPVGSIGRRLRGAAPE
ncbi:MAG TPA: malonyl-ACP O-methyltransferase BioC [Steroidobacteraceae bacterium]